MAFVPVATALNAQTVVVPDVPSIEKAARVDVDRPWAVVVARYKFPPAFLNVHCARPAPAESAN